MDRLNDCSRKTLKTTEWKSPYVLELYHTIGVYGAMLKVFVPDTEQFECFQQELGKYGNTTSSVILSSKFSQKELSE
ncbi:MAG: Lrp/AsnC ligand binding domain-containing protein [Blautia sp.]